jgi:hypothetical protein
MNRNYLYLVIVTAILFIKLAILYDMYEEK